MRIVGLNSIRYGVEDLDLCVRFYDDFGLALTERTDSHALFETLDGSTIELRKVDDSDLPPAFSPGPTIREAVWGVEDASVLDEIRAELSKDRQVRWDGQRLQAHDDMGLGIAFQLNTRRPYEGPAPTGNVPGKPGREINSRIEWDRQVQPIGIGHVVLNCADEEQAHAFYPKRLGFKLSDTFVGGGKFVRTELAREHHSLFTVQRAPNALNHVAFTVVDFHELMIAGKRMTAKGWKTWWGPGRHRIASNYFWYLHSPCGGMVEYTCDMDAVDESWEPGEYPFRPDMAAIWSARDFQTKDFIPG